MRVRGGFEKDHYIIDKTWLYNVLNVFISGSCWVVVQRKLGLTPEGSLRRDEGGREGHHEGRLREEIGRWSKEIGITTFCKAALVPRYV
jgi:hypothetical protein